MSKSPADTLTGLVIELRRILVHPDLQVADKLAAIGTAIDQRAPATEAEPGIGPG